MFDNEIAKNTNKYSITINTGEEEEDSKLATLDKNLEEINKVALNYASKMEESDINLDAEKLLNNILGNGLHE